MKKMNWKTFAALTLTFSVLGSTAVYADVMKGNTPQLIATQDEVKEEAAYITEVGKIVSLPTKEMDSYTAEIANENGGLRFALSPDTTLINREDGSLMTADQLKKDMEVMVIYSSTAPVGMSIPAYVGDIKAIVANPTKGNISVGTFDKELVNAKDKLKLNLDKTTTILSTLGTKSILTAEDVQGKDAIVFYDASTKSIPAQTTPSFVLLLEKREAISEEVVDAETPVTPEPVAVAELVALRDTATEKGYTVKWQGKNKPILLTKEKRTVSITLGKADYVVEEDMVKTAKSPAKLVDGVMYVSAEVINDLI